MLSFVSFQGNQGCSDKDICINPGEMDLRNLVFRVAQHRTIPPIEGTGNNKVTRERNHSNILNGGLEVFEGAININVSEEARRLDRVVSGTR